MSAGAPHRQTAKCEIILARALSLKLVVRATSLGDVHSMMLYPVMSSHREISPRQRKRK
jgi:cystathionine beta-lyase/cystathionine gamma-synthase